MNHGGHCPLCSSLSITISARSLLYCCYDHVCEDSAATPAVRRSLSFSNRWLASAPIGGVPYHSYHLIIHDIATYTWLWTRSFHPHSILIVYYWLLSFMVPPTGRILPTITYSDPTAGEPPQDVYRLFRGDSSPYTSICSKWRRILSAVVVIWRFVAPLSSSMAYTNAHDPSPTPLPLTFKNILLYVEKVAIWVLLPFNCRYIRDSGGYICCYCDEEHITVWNGLILW